MKVKPLSSLNRKVQSRASICACSMVSPERKRSCSLLPFAQRLGLDRHEGAALARADVLHLGGHPEPAVVFDYVAGADGIDRNFHDLPLGR
jgi:hypothetical protein